tara:strand:- start:329 stop:643 length:315 start_codon:yes stop_codon:yes gene_type:complete
MNNDLLELNKNIIELRNEIRFIRNELQTMKEDIYQIKSHLDIIGPQTQKMDEHVEFVNKVYDKVKRPFHFVFDNISYLISSSPNKLDLKTIQDKKKEKDNRIEL